MMLVSVALPMMANMTIPANMEVAQLVKATTRALVNTAKDDIVDKM